FASGPAIFTAWRLRSFRRTSGLVRRCWCRRLTGLRCAGLSGLRCRRLPGSWDSVHRRGALDRASWRCCVAFRRTTAAIALDADATYPLFALTVPGTSSEVRVPVRLKREAHDRQADPGPVFDRSEEHTSELQSLAYLVCRLLLE